MYFVVFVIYCYSVDATKTDALCRFVSDSPAKSSNCKMKICCFFDSPCLCFFAKTDIELGKELRYDYGDDENMCFYECFTFPRILIALYYFQRVSWNSLENRESFCMCFYVKMDDFLFVFFVCLFFSLFDLFFSFSFFVQVIQPNQVYFTSSNVSTVTAVISRTRFWMKNLHSVLWQWVMATRIS